MKIREIQISQLAYYLFWCIFCTFPSLVLGGIKFSVMTLIKQEISACYSPLSIPATLNKLPLLYPYEMSRSNIPHEIMKTDSTKWRSQGRSRAMETLWAIFTRQSRLIFMRELRSWGGGVTPNRFIEEPEIKSAFLDCKSCDFHLNGCLYTATHLQN